MHTPEPESLTLMTDDGYPIQALRYAAEGPIRGQLIVAGATGVLQVFYKHFARFAAARGYTTLTFDYRGIGKSKSGSLRGFRMRYLDWAHQDLRAVVDSVVLKGQPLYMVGHSFGGHAFGLLPNHHKVTGFYTFGTGAGWHGWMPRGEQIKVLFMWRVLGPLITRFKGYLAWNKLGFGEDLPLGVYQEWRHWCQYPRYFFDDPHMLEVQERFNSVTTPIAAANALDDRWAMPASRDAFMAGYCNATLDSIDIDPQTSGIGPIGHMGYFRRQAQPLWETALGWLEARHPITQST